MIIQAILGFSIFAVNLATYKYEVWPVKYLLFIQAVQMSLSNFNQFREGTEKQIEKDNRFYENFMGMNILVSVFSTMFVIMNVVLISFVFDNRLQKYIQIVTAFSFNILIVIFTNFSIKEDIDSTVLLTIVVSLIYSVILIVSFIVITNAITQEAINEAIEAGYQRAQYKSMFDSL